MIPLLNRSMKASKSRSRSPHHSTSPGSDNGEKEAESLRYRLKKSMKYYRINKEVLSHTFRTTAFLSPDLILTLQSLPPRSNPTESVPYLLACLVSSSFFSAFHCHASEIPSSHPPFHSIIDTRCSTDIGRSSRNPSRGSVLTLPPI